MRSSQGFALVLSLLIVVVVGILVLGTSLTSLLDRQVSANQQGAEQAYYIAQSGLQHYKTLVFSNLVDYQFSDPAADWCETPLTGGIGGGPGSPLESGESRTVDYGGGSYTVRYNASGSYIVLTSVGRIAGSRATVQLVATSGGGPAGAWDNALFATGRNPSTKKINGNVSVYGSVQIVNGELELDTDLALDGTAGVYNTYWGDGGKGNSDIRPAMGRVLSGNEAEFADPSRLPDLCAKIKIESGDLVLHGSGQAGSDTEAIYSIHLGDGVARSKNGPAFGYTYANDPDKKSPLYLRYPLEGEGVNSGYEGYAVPFPRLRADFPHDGLDIAATPSCAFLLDGGTVRLPPAVADACTDGVNTIGWDGNVLTITGLVNTGNHSLAIDATGAPGRRLLYTGLGAIRVGSCLAAAPASAGATATCGTGDATVTTTITGSVEPANGGFPETNALGIVSTGDVTISNKPGAEKEVAALMAYSMGEITLDAQTLVAGAVVATAFDLGQQVPKIAYHPGIRLMAGRLCMPGSYDVAQGCDFGSGGAGSGTAAAPLSDVSYERR